MALAGPTRGEVADDRDGIDPRVRVGVEQALDGGDLAARIGGAEDPGQLVCGYPSRR